MKLYKVMMATARGDFQRWVVWRLYNSSCVYIPGGKYASSYQRSLTHLLKRLKEVLPSEYKLVYCPGPRGGLTTGYWELVRTDGG